MTILEVIERGDRERPNAWGEREKSDWLMGLEKRLSAEFYPRYEEDAPSGPENASEQDVPLRASGAYEELYLFYLYAMMDLANGEIDGYNNHMTLFNTLMGEYRREYHRGHTPVASGPFVTGMEEVR